jgi:hypothetical protein
MTLEFLSSSAYSVFKWSGLASPETYLKDNEYVRDPRSISAPDPEIIKLIEEQKLLREAAKAAVDDTLPVATSIIHPSLQDTADAADSVQKIVLDTTPPSVLPVDGSPPSPPPGGDLSSALPVDGSPPPRPPGGNPPSSIFDNLAPLLPLIKKFGDMALPLIPPLLYSLYNSEKWILQNLDVNIRATPTPRTYTVGFGNKHGKEVSLDFEVVAGRFYQNELVECKEGFAPVIFQSKSWVSYVPLLRRFEWKREIYKTECNIIIDDPGNSSLQDGPISVYYPFSKNEGFNLIYRDPTSPKEMVYDEYCKPEDSKFTTFNEASMTVEPLGEYEAEHTETEDLQFTDGGYMTVTLHSESQLSD